MSQAYLRGKSTAATVTTSSAPIVDKNASRKYMIIRNRGTNPVYLSAGTSEAAIVGSGIMLLANEGWELTNDNMCTGSIQAIADGGTSDVCIFESSN